MADWPPSLKPIGKYIVRAREVQTTQPVVSYYCNYYALKQAIALRDTSDENAHRLVTGLLEKCEAEKAALGSDDGSHRGVVEEFALSVFDRADTEDREDRATRETAQTFYAAVCFFEVCRVFGELPSDFEQRLRYAKWKAVDISKALKEGRRPTPGAPGEAEAIEEQRRASEEQLTAEQAAPTAPPPEVTDGLNGRQEHGGLYRQSEEQVPPAPPMREYDSDLKEYQPQPMPKERVDGPESYPSFAPPYPSVDISPLPNQAPHATTANNTSAYPTINPAYPTADAPYKTSNSAYPSTSGYPAPSAPYIPPSAPYATVDASQKEPSKGLKMPPIPSLDIPGIGTNMGDPPLGQPLYPTEPGPGRWPPSSESSYAPPRSDLYAPSEPDSSSKVDAPYAPPRSDPYAPPESDSSYPPSKLEAPYGPPHSNRSYTPPRSDPSYPPRRSLSQSPPQSNLAREQPPPEVSYPPQRSDPLRGPRGEPDRGYAPQPNSFGQRGPATMSSQAPVQAAKPAAVPPSMQKPASTHVPSVKDAQDAQRLAKYAASALDFQDMKTAIANLEDALRLLKGA